MSDVHEGPAPRSRGRADDMGVWVADESTTRRCLECAYVLEGLPSPGMCPECSLSFDLSDQGTFTTRPPFMGWVFWAPGLILAAVGGTAVSAIMVFAMKSWGASLWFGVPFAAGCVLGYRTRVARVLAWIALVVAAGLSLIFGLMTLQIAGVFCGLVLSGILLLPLMTGMFAGFLLRARLKRTRYSQRWYLPALAIFSGPLLLGLIEGRPPVHPVESVSTEIVIEAPAAEVWRSIVFFEEVRHPAPLLLRVGLARPLYTRGSAERVGDVKVCVYNKGHITKRVTGVEPGRRLDFDVIEQEIGYERDVRLVGGSFVLEPEGPGRTRVTLITRYEPRLTPRFSWRWGEEWAVHLLHGHVLEGMRRRAVGEEPGRVVKAGVP